MNEMGQEDWLDRQLREAALYIDDNGFTARVLQQLPQPRRQRQSLRATILLGITLLASALAYVLSDSGRFISVYVERLATLPVLWLFAIALGSGLLVTTLGLLAAISKTSNLQS
jgi:hypothetical protein